jgi:hypothetical protein
MKDYCLFNVPPWHLLALQLVQYVNFKLNISWHKNKISSYYIIKPLKSQFDTNGKPYSLVIIDANNLGSSHQSSGVVMEICPKSYF